MPTPTTRTPEEKAAAKARVVKPHERRMPPTKIPKPPTWDWKLRRLGIGAPTDAVAEEVVAAAPGKKKKVVKKK